MASRVNGMTKSLWKAKEALALGMLAMLVSACNNTEPQATVPETTAPVQETTAPAQPNVTTEEVADKTNQLLGKTVTVRSEPVKKIAPNTFTITDEEFFGRDSILVVNATGKPIVLPADDDVEMQITGQVTKFVVADVNRRYGLDLDPNLYVEYAEKPAIFAQSVAPAPEPGEITEDPRQYYGKRLAVTGEVEDVVSPNSFTLDEEQLIGGNDLLVIMATPKGATVKPVEDGEEVAVTGVLRPFVIAELERDYDLTWDLDVQKKLEAEYSKKPVLVADAVYPSAIPDAAK